MKQKVLHILWSGQIGGATRAVYQLVRSQFEQSRFTPVLAFARAQGYYCDEARRLGGEVIDLGLTSDQLITRAWALKKIFAQYPVHHFHSAEITLILTSILSRKAVRVYTHRGGIIDYQGKQKLRYRIVGQYLRRYFQGLSGNTQHACLCGKKLFNTNDQAWRVTYNGLDFSLLQAQRSRAEVARELNLPEQGAVVIGTAAQLRDWKRIDLLLHACAQLPFHSFRLLIVGDGPAKPQLQNLAQALGLANHVIFTGMKERVGDYLGLMDIFVLPSVGLESFGNAAVEAMSQSIPTIVFRDGGGLLEHVQDSVNGYVVSSVKELAQRLQTLINNVALRAQMGRHAQTFVASRYTPAAMAAAYDELYDVALSKKNS